MLSGAAQLGAVLLGAVAIGVPSGSRALGQTVLRVDVVNGTAGGDGSGWGSSAFKFLQDGLAAAGPIAAGGQTVQVWIAAGTYRPDQSAASPGGTDDETSTFAVPERVQLYGGFAGNESDLVQRDGSAHVTTLHGALTTATALHVVTIANTTDATRLDGLTVTGGDGYEHGAGILMTNASPVCAGVRVTSNRSFSVGGGVYVTGGAPLLTGCEISNNTSMNLKAGGGVYNRGALSVVNCVFFGNTSYDGIGGAICSETGPGSSVTVTGSTFHDNLVTGGQGGAVAACDCTDCTFTNNRSSEGGAMFHGSALRCTFTGNVASYSLDGNGGAVSYGDVFDCTFQSNASQNGSFASTNLGGAVYGDGQVVGCTFVSNQAGIGGGGAVAGTDDGNGFVVDCTFISNSSPRSGGAMMGRGAVGCRFFSNSALRGSAMYNGDATNCVFSGNTASVYGAVGFDDSYEIVNCTFYANTNAGVSLFASGNAVVHITNSIFWKNTLGGGTDEGAQIHIDSGPAPVVRYCFVQGLTGALGGVGNIGGAGADPLLLNPDGPDGITGTTDDALSLRPGSPCIDAGDNLAWDLTSKDIDGKPRRFDDVAVPDTGTGGAPLVDMGAYEYTCMADYDENGYVNGEDFDRFAWDFYEADAQADVNRDGFVNGEDFDLFSLAFNVGC